MSLSRVFEYGFFDYSLTSPHFFLIGLGWRLLIFNGAYLWSRRKSAGRWSPLITLGQASLNCVLGADRNRLRTRLSVLRPVPRDFDGCNAVALAGSADALPVVAQANSGTGSRSAQVR